MRKKILVVTIFSLLIGNTVIAQCSDTYIANSKYPGLCVENIIRWLEQSRDNWSKEMSRYDFAEDFYDNGDLTFSTSSKHSKDGIQLMIQKPFGFITLINAPLSKKKNGLFSSLINEIEPYYAERKEGFNLFRFKFSNGKSYEFGVSERSDYDLIMCREL